MAFQLLYVDTETLILEAYQRMQPEIFDRDLQLIKKAMQEGSADKIAKHYEEMEKISIDYGCTEKMDHQEVVESHKESF